MQNFVYYAPTKVVFGRGAEEQTGALVREQKCSRALVVYGSGSAVKSGLLGRLESQLTEAGLAFQALGGVQPNPRLSLAREGVRQAIAFGADFFLGVGGGSVIDTAKAIAHGTANPDTDIWEFWSGRQPLEKTLPVGAVLTIAAAGSETSNSSVLTNEETGKKCGTNTDLNRPAFAIMNPELTYTLPKYQIACGVADILMHTLERYFTQEEGNDFTDRVAEALLKNVIFHGPRALANRKDYAAMSELMWCGSVSHNGFTGLGRTQDFAAHKLGHELSGKFDVAHGASLTTMWGSWARTVYMDKPERFAQFAEQVWDVHAGTAEEKARAGIRQMEEFFRSIGMPTCFTELGIGVQSGETLEYLADMCTNYGKKTVAVFHPIDRQLALELYRLANH